MEAFDAANDAVNYCRSLMTPEEVAILDGELKNDGIMPIDTVREFIASNTVKDSEFEHESTNFDAELILKLDVRINYNLYVVGKSVYNRKEIMERFPLEHFDKQPEDLLVQQEVAMMMDSETHKVIYTTRNYGHNEQFLEIGDRIRKIMGKEPKYQIVKSALSKIFIARSDWEGFIQIVKFTKNFKQHIAPLMINNASFQEMFGLTNQQSIADVRMKAIEDKVDKQLSSAIAERDQLKQINSANIKKINDLEAKLAALD